MSVMTYIDAINTALREEMERDPNVFIIGEDVAQMGGAFKATKGLLEEFGSERVIDSPLAEGVIISASIGAAMAGMRPVPEIQFVDFITPAMDAITQQAARLRYRSAGTQTCPLTVRVCYGGGVGGGLYHSQSNTTWFVHTPGLIVVAPSTPSDAKGMLKAAIRDDNPVMFFTDLALLHQAGEVPEGDNVVPLGKARIRRSGSDVTIVSYAKTVHTSLQAAEALAAQGISAEVVDLRTLKPLDEETIVASARRTGRVVVVHEANRTCGVGAEVAATVCEGAWSSLKAPVVRVTSPDTPAPASFALEAAFTPQVESIVAAVQSIAAPAFA